MPFESRKKKKKKKKKKEEEEVGDLTTLCREEAKERALKNEEIRAVQSRSRAPVNDRIRAPTLGTMR